MVKDWNHFYQQATKNKALKDRLKDANNQESFVKLAVKLGEEQGYSFTAADVEATIAAVADTMRQKTDIALESCTDNQLETN